MLKRISAAERTQINVAIVTLDGHLAGAVDRARQSLKRSLPGLTLSVHCVAEWGNDPSALQHCHEDIARADIIVATMLFMDEHIKAVLPALEARKDDCDAIVGCMSGAEIMRLTRLGQFKMDGSQKGPLALLKKLRGSTKKKGGTIGAKQVAVLKRIPKILRFIPGTAQDVRNYFLILQYWLAGSSENIENMVRLLIDRYADGPRRDLRQTLKPKLPIEYPELGLYHPRLPGGFGTDVSEIPRPADRKLRGTVGVLIMRSYVLAGNAAHYDGVIQALEDRGYRVIPAFASGLDARPAVEKYFTGKDGCAAIDALVSLTGFSLVGGPAYNDAEAAEDMLAKLDVPYVAAHALEFQTLTEWGGSGRGLMPVETTMMVAIPEIDGATGPMVFGGRANATGTVCEGCERHCEFADGSHGNMHACVERATTLADRVDHLISLRQKPLSERKVAAVIFNFPPNAGAVGTAAYLSVFESLFNTLQAMKKAGYTVELPESIDALRDKILHGNAATFGAQANVHARIPVADHVRRERWLKDIEAQWGSAPGKVQTDGASLFVLGVQFGNVFVGIQPAFGYEGDPMRLLFEKDFAPTHAFSAFYRYLRDDFGADAVLHFGTHGALEFMPGKQAGMSGGCWSDRLIGDLPNYYLYASNNPSEGIIAKRRAAATLVSYLTPPLAEAGLYRGLVELKASLERWRTTDPKDFEDRYDLAELIQMQAATLDLAPAEPVWNGDASVKIDRLAEEILELEYTLIPHGLHVVGDALSREERVDMLQAVAESAHASHPDRTAIEALVDGKTPEDAIRIGGMEPDETKRALFKDLERIDGLLSEDHEMAAILHALDGGFVRPAPGGDLIRTPAILPTGRNIHGFDPFRLPSAFAVADGKKQATKLLERHLADNGRPPESVALVLWGTDNLKTEGAPIAQALALMGAMPRFDGYGRLCGAELISLEELGRPRIDAVMTLSGIFRDLLPMQTRMLAEAAYLAASADEPAEQNHVRKHALAFMEAQGCDIETAAMRVFSNADGAYGSNVNQLVDAGCWEDEDELAEAYTKRKCFAYGRSGQPTKQANLLSAILADVDMTYQNLDSVELGVTTIDHYFDTLGGISRAVRKVRGKDVPVYISDQTRGEGKVRTLGEQVALETRTRTLNPKWYEGMLKHGYEGVRQIEAHVTNTMGWSATTGQVAPWVYQQLTQTFVLDPDMRKRLAELNPTASAKVANRLIEAHERNYWVPDDGVLEALREAGEELEDRLEGISVEAAA